MISVTYLLSDLGGGTGHHLFELLRNRPENSWGARIISEVDSSARLESPVTTETLPPTRFRRYPLAQVERGLAVRRRLREDPMNVLHTYFFWSIIYGRVLKATGTIDHLVENREDMGFAWGRHEYGLLRLTRRLPDRVICVSSAVRDVVLRREGIHPSRIRVVHNGIAAPRPSDPEASLAVREEFDIPPEAPIVGMVANFNRQVKGAVHYIDAIPLVLRDVPEARFLLIGLGDNRLALQARAEAAGVGDRLVFTGFRSDIDRLYDALDVSVLTSLSEGLSITLLESMRHGVPVVATDVGGNPEVVRDGETGFLVPPADPVRFAAAVVRLLQDRGLSRRLGERGRDVVSNEFRLSEAATAYSRIYRELIGSNA